MHSICADSNNKAWIFMLRSGLIPFHLVLVCNLLIEGEKKACFLVLTEIMIFSQLVDSKKCQLLLVIHIPRSFNVSLLSHLCSQIEECI